MIKRISITTDKETLVYRLLPCKGGRRDQYLVNLKGRPFVAKIGLTKLLEHIRKSV